MTQSDSFDAVPRGGMGSIDLAPLRRCHGAAAHMASRPSEVEEQSGRPPLIPQSEEEQNMRLKIMVGLAALAVGVALASVPAVAYVALPGYSSKGGVIARPHIRHSPYGRYERHLYNRALPKGGATVH